MIRCLFLKAHTRDLATRALVRGPRKFPHPRKCAHQIHRYYSSGDGERLRKGPSRYGVFDRIPRPRGGEPTVWIGLLDHALPPHLRKGGPHFRAVDGFSATDTAELLLAAQRLTVPANGIDLLFYLGFVENRWSAVVWIVKHLVEAFASPWLQPLRLTQTLSTLASDKPLSELTTSPINLPRLERKGQSVQDSRNQTSLDSLTDHLKPGRYDRIFLLQHNALGQIWRSLGTMTLACGDGDIKPEILEIIAFLHHKEIMPSTIYNAQSVSDTTQIQITPMLNLFSSRILTSLSDAAWRAHAKVVVDEAKARGGDYSPLRPEIPGTVFRVNVAGLRTEVWLELVLWSALLGGWVVEGIDILKSVARQPEPRAWKAYSWRSMMSDYEHAGQQWNDFKHMFNTGPLTSRDQDNSAVTASIHRTISSEVVNAYIDALPSVLRVGVGQRGVSPAQVLNNLTILRGFLRRSKHSLSAGSWEAIVWRYVDIQESVVHRPDPIEELAGLLPFIGEDLSREARRDLPAYILDGNTLIINLFHQALRCRVLAGDLEGSLRLLKKLQSITDKNKRQSLIDFLQSQRMALNVTTSSDEENFMSNFAGIDYPAFHTQIPATILSLLLELILDVKAYEFGKWLIYDGGIDDPVISQGDYKDPALLPSLIRYATETRDQNLMAKLLIDSPLRRNDGSQRIPEKLLQNFFNSQINLKNWAAATRLLLHLRDQEDASWNIHNLAYVGRAMLLEVRNGNSAISKSQPGSMSARELFKLMVQGHFDRPNTRGILEGKIDLVLLIIALVDASWAKFCLELRSLKGHYPFDLISGKTFDLLLRGIVTSYGSACGRRLVDQFWSEQLREAQSRGKRHIREESNEPLIPRMRVDILDEVVKQRTVIILGTPRSERITIYGGLRPSIVTIRIVLDEALTEFKQSTRNHNAVHHSDTRDIDQKCSQSDESPSRIIAWAIRRLRFLHVAEEDIRDMLSKRLSATAMSELTRLQKGILIAPSLTEEHIDSSDSI